MVFHQSVSFALNGTAILKKCILAILVSGTYHDELCQCYCLKNCSIVCDFTGYKAPFTLFIVLSEVRVE